MDFKIYKNTIILIILRIVNPFISIIAFIAMSRLKSLEIVGSYSFITIIAGMFGMVGTLGLQNLIVREIANKKSIASKYLLNTNIIGLLSSTIMMIMLLLTTKYYYKLDEYMQLCVIIVGISIIFSNACYYFEACFMAFERMDLIFYETVIPNVIRTIGIIVLLLLGLNLLAIFLCGLVTSVGSFIICYYLFSKNIGKICFEFDKELIFSILNTSLTFLLITIVGAIWWRIDILMLTKMTNMVEVALYSAAYKIYDTILLVPKGYITSSYPQISISIKNNKNEFNRIIKENIKYMSYYMFIMTFIIIIFAYIPIRILFGDKFEGAVLILKYLVIGLIPWGVARTFASILTANGMQKMDLFSNVIAAIINILLNIVLINYYKGLGAAVANSISVFIFCLLQYIYINRSNTLTRFIQVR